MNTSYSIQYIRNIRISICDKNGDLLHSFLLFLFLLLLGLSLWHRARVAHFAHLSSDKLYPKGLMAMCGPWWPHCPAFETLLGSSREGGPVSQAPGVAQGQQGGGLPGALVRTFSTKGSVAPKLLWA